MTVLSRGARARRGGRRPGWLLLTVLLVLAIAASSALVFTNRVELLKLAVILALWAAVVGAFVSVIYRRQSDTDQAKVRDLKLVYDLQLDREISARREYELSVETHLRRELTAELRAQASDEVAALRAELAALRTNLEILFDADLAHRPAIETDRSYGEWTRNSEPPRPDRVTSSRITTVQPNPVRDDSARDGETTRTTESPIIDVPEEPLIGPATRQQSDDADLEASYRGSHRRPSEDSGWLRAQQPPPAPQPQRQPPPRPEPPRPEPPRQQPAPSPQPSGWAPAPGPAQPPSAPVPPPPARENAQGPSPAHAPEDVPRGRHSGQQSPPPAERRGRHSSASEGAPGPRLAPAPPPSAPPAPRHRNAAELEEARAAAEAVDGAQEPEGKPGGTPAAELLARLQAGTSQGGGRRRRED
ncbi:hypothetical protein BH09ACT8_BH09ACT8_30020 [soil metagenome]